MKDYEYWVYRVASVSGTLYIGITNDINRRLREHKSGEFEGFASKYGCNRLVYYEQFEQVLRAISREKQQKGWRREKKIALIERRNPRWEELIRAGTRDAVCDAGDWAEVTRAAHSPPAVPGSFDSGVRPRSG